MVWSGTAGGARRGTAGHGSERQAGRARRGNEWPSKAGMARLGKAHIINQFLEKIMKNATLYLLQQGWPLGADNLSECLERHAFVACGPNDIETSGWVKPAEHTEGLVHAVGGQYLVAWQVERKILPPSVLRREVSKRVAAIEENTGVKVRRDERTAITEQTANELITKAFTSISLTTAWIDPVAGRLVINSPSQAISSMLSSALLVADDKCGLSAFKTAKDPSHSMSTWLKEGGFGLFTIDDECELVRDDDEKPSVRYQHHNLNGKDVVDHLSEGKLATRLAMTYNDRVSFVLTDKLQIRKIKLTDVVTGDIKSSKNITDKAETFDATFTIFCGWLHLMINALSFALGGRPEMIPANDNLRDVRRVANNLDDMLRADGASMLVHVDGECIGRFGVH